MTAPISGFGGPGNTVGPRKIGLDIAGENGPAPDPNPNFDVCNGQQGSDGAYGCEQANQVETIFPFP